VTHLSGLPRGAELHLIILDCDGVLFDSYDANVAFYDAILAELGMPALDDRGRELCHRLSGPQLWAQLCGADEALHARAKAVAARADYAPFYALMRPMVAMEDTLSRLAGHCPLALATNRGRTVEGVVRHFRLDRFLSMWFGILDVERAKPAPDLLLACLARAQVSPANAVYVGDMSSDREAAAAAGISYVGIGPRSEAVHRLEELRLLPDLLDAGRLGSRRALYQR
jgi:phosphoglycolate phosphatase